MNLFLLLTVLAVLCSVGITGILFRERSVAEILILGICYFLCSYITGTMGLFVLDQYTLFRGIAVTAGLDLLLLGISFLICRRNPDFDFKNININFNFNNNSKKILIPVIISLIGLAFVSQKNELFGMGQDEGVYQTVAINFLNGRDARQQDFAEYHGLETEDARETFRTAVHNKLVGYDIPAENYPDTVYQRDVSDVSGIYHGIPTYGALLALWGKLFGMAHMAEIQNLGYVLVIFLLYFLCENLGLQPASMITACSITALSPIVIWVSKSTLTELFLAVIILLFLYFLTASGSPGNFRYAGFSLIPVIVFGCYHVSIYTMIPYVILIYAGLYFFAEQNKKLFAGLLLLTPPVYLASYFAMRHVQPFYTMNNYRVVFVSGINVNNITQAVVIVCAILELFCMVYLAIVHRISTRKEILLHPDSRFLKWLLICMTALPLLYITYQATAKLETSGEIVSLTILGFVQNSGMILLPVGVVLLFARTRHFLESPEKLVIFVSFFYCVLIYSGLLRFQIDYYDYYARYLVPFIPVAVIFSVLATDFLGRKVLYPVMILSLCMAMPYSDFLRTHRDDTRMEWEILEDLTTHITDQDCVVIEDAYLATLWLPIRAITGAEVYPVLEDHPEEQLKSLAPDYENLYFISAKSCTYDLDYNLELIYTDIINCMEDKNSDPAQGMPLEFKAQARQIFCYAYLHDCLEYPASTINHFQLYGIGDYEKTFCWTNAENSAIRCIVPQEEYFLTVNLSCSIPLQELGRSVFPVRLLVNGRYTDTKVITEQNNGQSLTFRIPAKYLQDGSNLIGFETDLWRASVINPQDSRMLGIPLQSMEFEKIN